MATAPHEKNRKKGLVVGAVALVVVLVAGIVVGITVFGGDSSAGASVTLEPADNPGADPFTESVAIGPVVEFPANVQAINTQFRDDLPTDTATATLTAVGTAPGLYGGSGDTQVCNTEQLITFLDDNPDKAAAWAAVLDITPDQIEDYVNALTPVVLTSDTLVTNHGFTNGQATSLQSVLQAGTAVLVDTTGTPRVKCNCGNPLTPPAPITITDAHLTGTQWTNYQPAAVTTVTAGDTTNQFTLVNTRTGDNYEQPTGSGAAVWAALVPDVETHTTDILTSTDGKTFTKKTTVDRGLLALAYGNDTWMALTDSAYGNSDDNTGSQVVASTDLMSWDAVGTVELSPSDITYGSGRWVVAGVRLRTDGSATVDQFSNGVIATSTDGRSWQDASTTPELATAVSFGDGEFLALTASEGAEGLSPPTAVLRSSDGTTWAQAATVPDGVGLGLVRGEGQWLLGASSVSAAHGFLHQSRDGRNWTEVGGTPFADAYPHSLAFGGGQFVAASTRTGGQPYTSLGTTFFSSVDGESWSLGSQIEARVTAVAYGKLPTTSTNTTADTSTTTTPTTAPRGDITAVDWENHTYPDKVCGTDQPQQFTDGKWGKDVSGFPCSETFVSVDYADVTGDGEMNAIVGIFEYPGASAIGERSSTYVYAMDGAEPKMIGNLDGAKRGPFSVDAGVTVTRRDFDDPSPLCCPKFQLADTYKYVNGSFAKTATIREPINTGGG